MKWAPVVDFFEVPSAVPLVIPSGRYDRPAVEVDRVGAVVPALLAIREFDLKNTEDRRFPHLSAAAAAGTIRPISTGPAMPITFLHLSDGRSGSHGQPLFSRDMSHRRGFRLARFIRGLVLFLLFAVASQATMAIEEPDYRIVRTIGDVDAHVEIREYSPYVVAEVEVAGPASAAGGTAFPILAGYIFGKNQGARRMPMTAPVTETAAPMRLEMTAPVTQTQSGGGYVVQFVLPKGVTLDTAPEPLDPRIHLREVGAQRIAAIRYSGTWSQANYDEHLARLQSVLAGAELPAAGPPVYSRYDAPFMPWFLRRNEIWIPLRES